MSNLYPNLVYTSFPDEPCDTYEYMQDLTSDLVSLVSQYETLMKQNKFNEANKLLTDNPSLNKIYFNAEKYNKLIDSIKAIQLLYSQDIQTYILELAKYMGNYSSTTKYTRYNVVQYNDSMIYMCISTSVPLGTPPTNTKYWFPLSIKGDKGDKGDDGLGLHFSKEWSASETYSKDAAVSYGTCLYASLVDSNKAHTPAKGSSYWNLIVDFNTVTAFDNSAVGTTTETTMQGALEELYSLSKTNKKNISTNATNISANTSSISTINSKLDGIESGAQKNTVTGVKGSSESSYRTGNVKISPANLGITVVNNTADADKSVKYATSAGSATIANSATTAGTCTGNAATATSANYATSAGNSDTVDGFHFKLSTTDLTAGSSSLATNTFYFVYE